jgi:hypothetical protein
MSATEERGGTAVVNLLAVDSVYAVLGLCDAKAYVIAGSGEVIRVLRERRSRSGNPNIQRQITSRRPRPVLSSAVGLPRDRSAGR